MAGRMANEKVEVRGVGSEVACGAGFFVVKR